jgi:hypothetical protein
MAHRVTIILSTHTVTRTELIGAQWHPNATPVTLFAKTVNASSTSYETLLVAALTIFILTLVVVRTGIDWPAHPISIIFVASVAGFDVFYTTV